MSRLFLSPADVPADALIIDTREPEAHAAGHIPGAAGLPYARYVRPQPPAMALLPEAADFAAALGGIGLRLGQPVLAYDEGASGKAARLLWTLAAAGHTGSLTLLDGGLPAWVAAGGALTREAPALTPTRYPVAWVEGVVADRDWVLAHLGDAAVVPLDTRSAAEYAGLDVRTAAGGHIPGAVNFDWVRAMQRDGRLRADAELRAELEALGVTPDKEIVVYCQTHHRSAHTWVVLKQLGYARVRGYAGAWSEWGNTPRLPIER